jgi:hypothetical protein
MVAKLLSLFGPPPPPPPPNLRLLQPGPTPPPDLLYNRFSHADTTVFSRRQNICFSVLYNALQCASMTGQNLHWHVPAHMAAQT